MTEASTTPKQTQRAGEIPDFSILGDDPGATIEEEPEVHYYPFPPTESIKFDKANGIENETWFKDGFDLQSELSQVRKPIIEIGGPTVGGYHMLDEIKLPSRPIITNIARGRMPDSDALDKIDELVDGTQMPYGDKSLGVVIMSGIDRYDGVGEDVQKKAEMELKNVADTLMEPQQAKYSLRLKIYNEVLRCLADGGLLIAVGLKAAEIKVLERIGFELKAYEKSTITPEAIELGSDPDDSYEVVMKKISTNEK